MKNSITSLLFIAFGVLLWACRNENPEALPTVGTPTDLGMPVGDPVHNYVGPAGKKIIVDGGLTIDIPAGALKEETLIIVQPVENKAFGATGLSYQVLPKGLQFEKPVRISWNYGKQDVQGSSADALGVAFQQADQSWSGRRNIDIDKPGHKASFSSAQPGRFAFYEQYYIKPGTASLSASETVRLDVFFQKGREDPSDSDMLEPLTPHVLLKNNEVRNWLVNGQNLVSKFDPLLGGMTIIKEAASATYTAPDLVPEKDTIAVSTEVILKKSKLILISTLVIQSENEFTLNGFHVKQARVSAATVVDGELVQIGLYEGKPADQKQNIVNISIVHFAGTGTYEADASRNLRVSCQDHLGKPYNERYYAGNSKYVYGPMKVAITEYDKAKKLVAGQVSGTVYYQNEYGTKTESASLSAKFKAASPY
jgi:hypothetical protein